MHFGYHGILGTLILVGDIWAILNIAQAPVSNGNKLAWILTVIFLPLLGLILWFLMGPRSSR